MFKLGGIVVKVLQEDVSLSDGQMTCGKASPFLSSCSLRRERLLSFLGLEEERHRKDDGCFRPINLLGRASNF